MPRTKKSIKNRSKTKKQALKRKRARRNKSLRRGMHPADAGMAALRDIVTSTVDPRLLNARGRPNFNVKLYIVAASGEYAGVALHGGDGVRFAVCTEHGAELRRCESLFGDGDQFVD